MTSEYTMVIIKEYSDGLVVRTAGPEDKEAIAEIQVYGDLEYIESLYNHYMENPNYLCFLSEFNGQVVSTVVAFVC